MPVPSAAPWPRLIGWRSTWAPARAACPAVSSDEPSSTTITLGSQAPTLASVLLMIRASLKPGITIHTDGFCDFRLSPAEGYRPPDGAADDRFNTGGSTASCRQALSRFKAPFPSFFGPNSSVPGHASVAFSGNLLINS